MTPETDRLFALIKSLRWVDRRAIREYFKRTNRDGTLELWDFLLRQLTYDEAAIRAKFKGKPFLAHLSKTKGDLYRSALRALRIHYKGTADTLMAGVQEANILVSLGRFDDALDRLKETKKEAYKQEQYAHLLTILDLEMRMVLRYVDEKKDNWLARIEAEIEKAEAMTRKLRDLSRIERTIETHIRVRFHARGKFDATEAEILARDVEALTEGVPGKRVALIRAQLRFLLAGYQSKWEEALSFGDEYLGMLDDTPHLAIEYRTDYFVHVSTMVRMAIDIEDAPRYERMMRRYEQFDILSEEPRANFWYQKKRFAVGWAMVSGDFEEARRHMKGAWEEFEQYAPLLPLDAQLGFFFEIGSAYLRFQEPDKAITWLRRIINHRPGKVRIDLQCYARILLLMARIDRDDLHLIDSELRQFTRFIREKRQLYMFESRFLRYLTDLTNAPNPKSRKTRSQTFLPDLQALKDHDTEWVPFLYHPFDLWVTRRSE